MCFFPHSRIRKTHTQHSSLKGSWGVQKCSNWQTPSYCIQLRKKRKKKNPTNIKVFTLSEKKSKSAWPVLMKSVNLILIVAQTKWACGIIKGWGCTGQDLPTEGNVRLVDSDCTYPRSAFSFFIITLHVTPLLVKN